MKKQFLLLLLLLTSAHTVKPALSAQDALVVAAAPLVLAGSYAIENWAKNKIEELKLSKITDPEHQKIINRQISFLRVLRMLSEIGLGTSATACIFEVVIFTEPMVSLAMDKTASYINELERIARKL